MKTNMPGIGRRRIRPPGFALIECLIYAFVTMTLFGIALAAFYRCVENSMVLRRNADDIANALIAGERWRDDVRAADGRIVLQQGLGDEILILSRADRQVAYQFQSNAVWRRTGDANWVCALTNVKSSAMLADVRGAVSGWRWELELRPRTKRPSTFRPLFTFLAAPERSFNQ
jgi:hypothetical protein